MDVVITSLGVCSGLGDSPEEFWDGLLAAAVRPDPLPGVSSAVAYRHHRPDLPPGPDRAQALGRHALLGAVGAGLDGTDPARVGLFVATGLGAAGYPGAESDYLLAGRLAAELPVTGPVRSVGTGCSAGLYALTLAAEALRAATVDAAVVVGVEALDGLATACLARLDVLDPVRCRPFDLQRRGMVQGEGAAALLLRRAPDAGGTDRPVRIAGSGWSCDAHHVTGPQPGGAALGTALRAALEGLDGPLGAVVPHRAGIAANDDSEWEALVGTVGPTVPLYGVKAMIGHTGGAAGAFAALTAVLALRHGCLPPNAEPEHPDPALPVPVTATPLRAPAVLVSGSGFGGNNAAVLLVGDR